MSEVKNKRILKEIAKRYAKSLIFHSEPMREFAGLGLTDNQVDYISECLLSICESISDKGTVADTETLVKEYFESENK